MRSSESTQLYRILERLVAFDTVPTTSNVPAAEYLADLLDVPGWTVRLHRERALGADKASVVAWAGPPEPDGLILSGHMDVVPFSSQPGWTSDPLRLVRRGDRLVARGVADMKAFLAQCVELAPRLPGRNLHRPLVLILTCDEEVGCQGAGRLVPHVQSILGELPLPPEAIIGEPTSFRVYSAHKGHISLTLEARGRGGHSSRPDLGTNAIAVMAHAGRELEALAEELARRTTELGRELFPEYPGVALNLGIIEGGTADNMIAERCRLTLGVRPLPGDDPIALVEELTSRAAAAVTGRYSDAALVVEETGITPAMASPRGGRLPEVLGRLTGENDLGGAPFATDGGQLERLGVHSYIWGPGELGQAHQPDESLPIEALHRGSELLERIVHELCIAPATGRH